MRRGDMKKKVFPFRHITLLFSVTPLPSLSRFLSQAWRLNARVLWCTYVKVE